MITKRQEKHSRLSWFLVLALALVAAAASVGYGFSVLNLRLNGRFYPQVFMDGQPIGRATKTAVLESYRRRYLDLKNTKITVLYRDAPLATLSAQDLRLRSDYQTVTETAYAIGHGRPLITRLAEQINNFLQLRRYQFSTHISYDAGVIRELISRSEDQFNQPARNARFTFVDNRVVSFRQEEKGVRLESEKLQTDLDAQIASLKQQVRSTTLVYHDEPINPDITLAQANQFGIETTIGVGKSNFRHSLPERVHNIILAAAKFNGILIPKGEVFSFNDAVGDISSSTGYEPAYIIKQGRTVLGDGGGVCQVSTTFFRAALNSGLPIVERHAHAYRVSYYENDSSPGLDATIFAPSVDLKVKNNTPAAILIQTNVDQVNTELSFVFYGKSDGRQVKISSATVYDVQPPGDPVYQDDPTLKKGVVKQIDFAAWGAKVNFYYTVTLPGEKPVRTQFFSDYQPWRAVFLVGQAE
ncbi:VanW family protein [Patescibacteria group bacterium]|nr:VanW family protein [Patescibacteria group bacterium]MCL5091726.1 VanW family protein [Patescibacteria group bacterium]